MWILMTIKKTPLWVWPLLAFLIYRGVKALRPGVLAPWRMLLLPVFFLVWALLGILTGLQDMALALITFVTALAGGGVLGWQLGRWQPCATIDSANGFVHRPGSAIPLILICLGFSLKYALSVLLARRPELSGAYGFCAAYGAGTGVVAGTFWGVNGGSLIRAWRCNEAALPTAKTDPPALCDGHTDCARLSGGLPAKAKPQKEETMLITMRQVTKTYAMGAVTVQALNGVDLDIDQGEFISIWGPSGSGKTTLLNMMGAVDTATSGRVMVAGSDLARLNDNQRSALRNRFIGFVFQRYNLIPVLTALENVMLPLQIQGVYTAAARKKALEHLAAVGLAAVANHRPDQMSGGQQQRVAVARALITDPALVIADEPTANLDSQTARQLIDLMGEIHQRQGTTFIFSTHDERLLERVDRRVQLKDGCIHASQEAAS